MTQEEFINKVIDDGIQAVKEDYTREDQKDKLEGSVAGFEACRNKSINDLILLLHDSAKATSDAYFNKESNYWYIRCFEAEVEWVCNCVSAVLVNQGFRPITIPTARGMLKAAEIINSENDSWPEFIV